MTKHNKNNIENPPDIEIDVDREGYLKKYAIDHGLESIEDFESFPKYFLIESCGSCNARCTMCPVEDVQRDKKLMPKEMFDRIVEEIKPHAKWIKQVALQAQGEPMLDKRLEYKISEMKKIGVETVTIISNGSLATAARAEKIIEAGLDFIDFSFDGSTKETFEKIRVRLDFDEVTKNIEDFIKARDRLNPDMHIRIRFTIQDSNRHEYEDFKKYWNQRLGGNTNDLAYGKELHHWANWMDYEPYQLLEQAELNATPCQSPFSTFAILNDGRVALCCNDYNASVCFGNIMEESISDIWKNEKFVEVRKNLREQGRNGVPACVNCNAWDPKAKVL